MLVILGMYEKDKILVCMELSFFVARIIKMEPNTSINYGLLVVLK
jgi:hypothetical protein